MAVQLSKLALIELVSTVPETKSEGILRPTTSNDTGRYEWTGLAEPYNMQISSGLFISSRVPEPSYLPPYWSAHIHPEGQLYFCREGSPRVVTEAYLYRPETIDRVTRWIKKIEDMVVDKGFPVSDQLELFIEIEDEDCAYYFVDHATHAESWMEEIDTDDLGLPPVVSVSQLNILLEELYWSHVGHFPMHIGGVTRGTLDSLVCVFMHAICDQMTSCVSKFPYSKQECEAFVSLLKNSRDHVADGNITCIVARLWSLVYRNRYLTHYGQENSRLSRDQAVLYDPKTKNQWVSTVASGLSFKTSCGSPPTPTLSLSLDEARNVPEMRDKIKGFLAAQGMIKGHARSSARDFENDLPIKEDSSPSSPESHTLSSSVSPTYHASYEEELYSDRPN